MGRGPDKLQEDVQLKKLLERQERCGRVVAVVQPLISRDRIIDGLDRVSSKQDSYQTLLPTTAMRTANTLRLIFPQRISQ